MRTPSPSSTVGKFFYENEEFAKKFEVFVNDNAHIIDVTEIQETGVMKVEYTELYNRYQELFENSLSEFIESKGSTILEFYEALQASSEKEPDGEDAIFGQIVTATADFDIFMQMMQEAAQSMPDRK
ncbi:hypothetical protein TeGR_g12312 [Tetraparma gracilis]|uniref:Cilia- and flagella-associated protein 36 n=1 Tax=Tetraparma gracilis TaxID=2962635 RepID=A0ABQ6N5A0_9STRA|nr:hypothetical protein TeGR_g12312 [Tetraparma gracilis]